MAELSARRVTFIAVVAGALVGGAVSAGAAVASTGVNRATSGSSSTGSPASLTTATVVRTTLSTTVQVGGSIGYDGSYSIAAPTGTSPQQLAEAQQAVTVDEQSLAADQMTESDAGQADDQAVAMDKTNVDSADAMVKSDRDQQTKDCAGEGATTSACSADTQKVRQDQSQATQADQQLVTAQASATRDRDQNRAKITADQTKLAGDQATATTLQATAVNPGTTFTALPQPGAIIDQNQSVYTVSNDPVPLLYGSIAAYRAFYVGMSDGADIGQLTHDLITLGYGTGLTETDHYSTAIARSVERWQRSLGLPATGQVLLGEVVFEPGPIRVTSVTPAVGATISAGGAATVLTATSTTPVVTVALDVTQEYLVKPGDQVTVVLPDGTTTVGGHVKSVGDVATCPSGGSGGTGNGSSSADQSPCSAAGSGSTATPTVTLTVTLDATPPGARLDQAPVNVNLTTQQAPDVLAVPVNALLALQGGGYGVQVVTGSTSRLVGVTAGLYSNSLVQVTGTGIVAGTQVEVPSS